MPKFSAKSQEQLSSCHADLQTVCHLLIEQYDFTVLEGYRGKEAQERAFMQGKSRVHFPCSAHNCYPARAVDIVPYPIDWKNEDRFAQMIIRFDTLANVLRKEGKIKSHFVYGGYWAKLKDWPHIEIKEK